MSRYPLRMYPNFTYQVAYHPVGHLISTPGGARVIRIPESSSRPPWMYRNFTYPLAYHPVGHLISTWGSSIRQVCKWTENYLHRKLRFLDIKTRSPFPGNLRTMASRRKRPASEFSTTASQSATSAGMRKSARVSNRQSAEASASPLILSQIFFAKVDGEKFVELTSLAKRVQNKKQGDKALASVWRRLGHDVLIPPIDGVRGVPFPKQKGHAREKLMPAANLRGFEAYVGELNEDDVDANRELLLAIASELLPAGDGGGSAEIVGVPFQLASRHKAMKLGDDDGARVHVVKVVRKDFYNF